MGDYWNVTKAMSDCVHFMYATQIDDADNSLVTELEVLKIKYAYIDYTHIQQSGQHVANAIATSLELQHAPYGPRKSPFQPKEWIPLLDDLVALSHEKEVLGLAIIIDNADVFLKDRERDFFELIESFLIQFSDWFEKKKPCHLCFQMEKDERVRKFFES